MQKSIKKIFSIAITIALVISMMPAVVFAEEITPIDGPKTVAVYSSYDAGAAVNVPGGKQVPSNSTNGLRVYANVYRTGTTSYSYDSYLVYTLDVDVNQRVETNTIAAGVYARIYFGSAIIANLPAEATGVAGDRYKLTVIVTPDKNVYVYCNNKLYNGNSANLPATITDIRYYEKAPVDSSKTNILTFTNPTVIHYDSTCELSDVLAAHAARTTATVDWTSYRGVSKGNNTFTNNSQGAILIDNNFGRTLKVGQDSFVVESSISVNERNETLWRNEALGMGVTMMVLGTHTNGSTTPAYIGIPVEILQENKDYPLTMLLGRDKNIYVSLGDVYAEFDLSSFDTITGIRYCEGNAVDVNNPNELVFEPANYTFFASNEGVNNISALAGISAGSEPIYCGFSVVEGDIDLKEIEDKDGNKNLTSDTIYTLIAARFYTALKASENNVEYGMLLSEEVVSDELTIENYSEKAVGARNVNGSFGVLLHGGGLVPEKTIYARPYLKYLNKYYYGDGQTIVIPQAESAE